MFFMKRKKAKFLFLLIFFFSIFPLFPESNIKPMEAKIRPIIDEVGFCWNYESMKKIIAYLEEIEKDQFSHEGLVAGISPHDDYLYAGRIYYPLYKILRAKEIVIFGVTHSSVRNEIKGLDSILILDEFDFWQGLLKPVGISGLREYLKINLKKDYFIVNNRAHELEHSIEALIPFLQFFNPDVKITPIMVAPMPFEKMQELSTYLSSVISDYIIKNNKKLGEDIFFLISADANHYGRDFGNIAFGEGESAWEKALSFDRRLIDNYLTGIIDEGKIRGLTGELWGKTYLDYKNSYWCGKYSIPFGLLTVEKIVKETTNKKICGKLFRFSDTYSEGVLPLKKIGIGTTAPFSLKHWVSFFSAGYYIE